MSSELKYKLMQANLFDDSMIDVTHEKFNNIDEDLSVIEDLYKMGIGLHEVPEDQKYETDNCYIVEEGRIVYLTMSGLRCIRITNEMLEVITKLTSLRELVIDEGGISKIPDSISNLKNLRYLNIRDNCIEEIPNELFSLPNLENLCLEINEIEKIPEEISFLRNIKYISLANNKINDIPISLLEICDKADIILEGNPIEDLIPESRDVGTNDFIRYVLSVQNKDTIPLNEAKILVLGNERVGKTSIINRIVGNRYEENQLSTFGIDIQSFSLSTDIKVNIWDFAGQEITHQLHQFFINFRSLFIFVLDVHQADNDSIIYDWLETISSYAKGSSVIVVLNKIDLKKFCTFDKVHYQEKFPNLVEVVYTSAQDNINIDILLKVIEDQVEKIENVRTALNKDWFNVKETLENLPKEKDFIETIEFDKICEENNIYSESDQKALLNILHQIGTVVKYENSLNNIQILNPVWVTKAVYKIMRSELLSRGATLDENDINEIFKDDIHIKDRHKQWLINLFIQFELAFRINDNKILVPYCLSSQAPDFDLNNYNKGLHLRYRYVTVLKKSVFAQFMAKMSNYFAKVEVPYWGNGLILERSGINALVISNTYKNEILIYIDSNNRFAVDFLVLIQENFKEVNRNKEVIEEFPIVDNGEIIGYKKNNNLSKFATLKPKRKNQFDYEKLRDVLIDIATNETTYRQAIYEESENKINDRFKSALTYKNYRAHDQPRGGESVTGMSMGERDIVIYHNKSGIAVSILEAFILEKSCNSIVISEHYKKLTERYDTSGNEVNFILVYSKSKDFENMWEKYKKQKVFVGFEDTEFKYSSCYNVKVGLSQYKQRYIYHIFINFYSVSTKL